MAPITYGHDMPQPKRAPKPPKSKPKQPSKAATNTVSFLVAFLGL